MFIAHGPHRIVSNDSNECEGGAKRNVIHSPNDTHKTIGHTRAYIIQSEFENVDERKTVQRKIKNSDFINIFMYGRYIGLVAYKKL